MSDVSKKTGVGTKKKKSKDLKSTKRIRKVPNFLKNLSSMKKRNSADADVLDNYTYGFDVPKKVINSLMHNKKKTNVANLENSSEVDEDDDDDDDDDEDEFIFCDTSNLRRSTMKQSNTAAEQHDTESNSDNILGPLGHRKRRADANAESEIASKMRLCGDDNDNVGIGSDVGDEFWVPIPQVNSDGNRRIIAPWKTRANTICGKLFEADLFQLLGVSNDKSKCLVKCEQCRKTTTFVTKQGSSSNLVRHAQTAHKELFDHLNDELKDKLNDVNLILTSTQRKPMSYEKLRDEVIHFFVKENLPLHKLESQNLKRLILNCSGNNALARKMKETKPKAPLFSRRAGSNRAKKLYEMHISDVKNRLKNVQYMSATCDIWSCKHRSFIAVNICYIDPKSFEQKSFLIAIDRFEGSHTNDAVAAKLKDIFKRFHILGKVVGVTTDNASEFVVAFQRFGDNYATYENYLNLNERDEVAISDSTAFEAEQLRSDADAIILSSDDEGHGYDYDSDDWLNVDVDESLPPIIIESIDDNDMETTRSLANEFGQSTATTAPDENFHLVPIPVQVDFRTVVHDDGPSEVNTLLPIRIKCAAHTLNLLGKTDAIKALQNKTYAAVYCKVMAKLNLLWRYCGHRKKCEIIKQYIGKVILRPHKIRWNALYDSIHEIVQIDASKLDALFFKLHIAVFTESERQFLGEYLNVLQPIAHGLTRLEGNIFFAYFLITLFNVDEELRLLESTNLKFAKPLLKALRNGFDTRFKEMMDINNAASVPLYLAMLSHPLFKLNFLPMLKTKERSTALEYIAKCKGMLLKAIEDIDYEQNNNQTAQSSNSDEFDVASLLDMECGRSDIILLEIKNFLRDKLTTDFESTFRIYPNMKEVFLKFNCLMTSEANCERIFSYADAISFGSYVKENMTIRCTMPLFYPTIV